MTATNNCTGEEKKTLAPLLAKLHISPASTPALLKDVYSEASIAIEDKLISDATGRNALFKIHVSLGKIANTLKDKELADEREMTLAFRGSTRGTTSRKSSVAPSLAVEESVLDEEDKPELVGVKEEEEESEGTVMGDDTAKVAVKGDELLEELLSDGDVEMSGL